MENMMNSKFTRVLAMICLGGTMMLGSTSARAQDEGGEGGGDGGAQSTLVVDDGGQGDQTDAGTNNGPWVSFGVNLWSKNGSDAGMRFEGGWPLMDISEGRLSLVLPFVWNPGGNNHTLSIVPGVRFEWPVLDKYGQLLVWGDFGFGVNIFTGGPGSTTYAGMRFASGATFIFPFNMLLTMQPVGVMANMGHNPTGGAAYEFMTSIGYRF